MQYTRLSAIIEPVVTSLGYTLWGIEYLNQAERMVLRVYIDTPEGIKLKDCETVTRQLNTVLDVEAPLQGRYFLEVSSPGMTRPLFKLEQYVQSIGKSVWIRAHSPIAGRRNFTGTLQGVIDETIELTVDGESMTLSYADIEKAHWAE